MARVSVPSQVRIHFLPEAPESHCRRVFQPFSCLRDFETFGNFSPYSIGCRAIGLDTFRPANFGQTSSVLALQEQEK